MLFRSSRHSLQYLQMVHLHLIGDGMDNLLRAQEKTNDLLGKMVGQQTKISEQLEDILHSMGALPIGEEESTEKEGIEKEGANGAEPSGDSTPELPDEDTEEQDGVVK